MNTDDDTLKTGIAVYCKCGGIIHAVTDDCYIRNKDIRKGVDKYFDKGFLIGKVSKKEVEELFECKCNPLTY